MYRFCFIVLVYIFVLWFGFVVCLLWFSFGYLLFYDCLGSCLLDTGCVFANMILFWGGRLGLFACCF